MIDWLKREVLEPEIELNAVRVPITLKRHSTAKRLTMRLAPDGSEVRITLPRWARSAEAIAFAHARTDWLAEQHAKVPQSQSLGPGDTLQFRGQAVRLQWEEKAPRKPHLSGDAITIGGANAGLSKRLQRWLESEALSLFEGDIADYTAAAGLYPVPVGLSRAQRRWGSCSDGEAGGQKRIRINWRLIQAPDHIRRSVVAHEVAHLIHFDHSPAFHALLGEIYEGDIKTADRWLKARGRELYLSFG